MMIVVCFCDREYWAEISFECPKCGQMLIIREAGETQEEFFERYLLYHSTTKEINSLPTSQHDHP